MIRPQAVADNFSRASARYDRHATLQAHWRTQVLEEATGIFPPSARVLDIGCGTGAFAAAAPAGWRVSGIDLAYGMCQQSGAIQADAQALPIASNSMDGVVSSLCLQWVENTPQAMREIHRVLRVGGHAVLMTLGQRTLHELRALGAWRLLPMQALAHYVDAADSAGLEVMAAQATVEIHAYPNLAGLLRSFRAIGAQAAFAQRAQALTPSHYQQLSLAYQVAHAHPDGGVAASWEPLLLVLRKGEH